MIRASDPRGRSSSAQSRSILTGQRWGLRVPVRLTSAPPTTPVTKAAISLKIANGQPRKAAVTRIESTPVCGVLIMKEVAAPGEAP